MEDPTGYISPSDYFKQQADVLRAELAAANERAERAERERDGLRWRIAETGEVLDRLGDVLADSEDLRVRETPAIETINLLVTALAAPAEPREPEGGGDASR